MAEDTKALVRKIIEEYWSSAAGLEQIGALVAPGYVHHAALADIDWEGFKRGAMGLLSAFPDIRFTVTHIIADGDLCAVHLRATGTHLGTLVIPGPFEPIAPTNRVVNSTVAYHCHIVDGRIVEDWDVWTALGLVGQIATILRMPPRL